MSGSHCRFPTNSLECIVKHPFHCLFHRLVEHVRQGWDGCQSKLCITVSQYYLQSFISLTPIGPHVLTVVFFALLNALPEYFTILCIVNAGRPILAIL